MRLSTLLLLALCFAPVRAQSDPLHMEITPNAIQHPEGFMTVRIGDVSAEAVVLLEIFPKCYKNMHGLSEEAECRQSLHRIPLKVKPQGRMVKYTLDFATLKKGG